MQANVAKSEGYREREECDGRRVVGRISSMWQSILTTKYKKQQQQRQEKASCPKSQSTNP